MFNLKNFKKDSVFLVTGCAGFIGSHLVENLISNGFSVIGIDNLSNGTFNNISEYINQPKFEFIEGDIRDFDLCLKYTNGVDYILHQAAWGSVPRSIIEPLIYEEVNIKGTLNIFESARINSVKRVVFASSSSVYGDSSTLPKVEGFEGNVLSPYALTKKANEHYGRLYFKLYGLETIGLRYFNVFGPRQNPFGDYAAVIPKFVNLILNNQSPNIYGDGKQTRDYTYIDNVVNANLLACTSNTVSLGKSFNIAGGEQTSLNDLFNQILIFTKNNNIQPNYIEARLGDIYHSYADLTNSIEFLNYKPHIDILKGLECYLKDLIT